MRRLLRRRPSPALIVASLALFVALGGPAYAAKLINGKNIRKGTVTSKQIKDRGIAVRDLSKATVSSMRYTPNDSITASKIRKNAVNSSEINTGAVTSLQVADNSLLAQDLATGSVDSDEIVDGGVKNADIATSAVSKAKLAGNSVGTSEVSDGSLTGRDIGAFSGKVPLTFGEIKPGACQTVATPAQTPLNGAQDLRDDLIVVGRAGDLPATVTLAAQPDPANATAFNVIACNVAQPVAPDTGVFAGGTYTLPFITINP